MNALAAEWDTLGWVCFRQNDLTSAEKYVEAGWQLAQYAAGADHLGQIYEKQGRHEAAIRMWKLAVAANSNEEDAKERLRLAGKSVYSAVTKGNKTTFTTSAEDLVQLRTIKIPGLPKQTATAEFFLLISPAGMEDVQFINGSDSLKDAARAIREVPYKFPFSDAGPEKLIRRGILSCSTYTTPSCQLTLLLPSTARKN